MRGAAFDAGLYDVRREKELLEAFNEVGAVNQPDRQSGHMELGGQKRVERLARHRSLCIRLPLHGDGRHVCRPLYRCDNDLGGWWALVLLLLRRKSCVRRFTSGSLSVQQTATIKLRK